MKGVKITALSELGQKGLEEMKRQCAKAIVRIALKKIQTKIVFNIDNVTIENPAMFFCKDLNHSKSKQGIQQIISAFKEFGAEEGKDYKIEVVKQDG